MKRTITILSALLALVACNRMENGNSSDTAKSPVRIDPVITRVTDVNFEEGDVAGLSITLQDGGKHAVNAPVTFRDGVFSGDLFWYTDAQKPSDIMVYYPYDETVSSFPSPFRVETDQRGGISGSDLIIGYASEVYPTKNTVTMQFRHRFSKVRITICNTTGKEISDVVLRGSIPVAVGDASGVYAADPDSAAEDIHTCLVKKDTVWQAIVVPQEVEFEFVVNLASGKTLTQKLKSIRLEPFTQYSISAVVNDDNILIVTSGQIEDWLNGGDIPGPSDPDFEEHLDQGYFKYHGVDYPVAKFKYTGSDGSNGSKWWMTANLRYVPKGYTPSKDLGDVAAGVFYPVVVSNSAAAFSDADADIEAQGYLYQSEVALGLRVGGITKESEARALEGAQGICPTGWHIPTIDDITGLVGRAVSPIETNPKAPYYDGSNGSIYLLNEDGFNIQPCGAVTVQDNTKTSASLMGYLKSCPDRISSGYYCGSTFASVTYLTSDDASSGIKNVQFFGLMPMTNKATEKEYTCNGSKLSYMIGASVRCVRDGSEQ